MQEVVQQEQEAVAAPAEPSVPTSLQEWKRIHGDQDEIMPDMRYFPGAALPSGGAATAPPPVEAPAEPRTEEPQPAPTVGGDAVMGEAT